MAGDRLPDQSPELLRWAPRSVDRGILPHGCVLPPPPPGCRYVAVRWLGVVVADDDLRRRIDRFFHAPMIVLALLVLPLLLLDYLYIRETSQGAADGSSGPTTGWLWLLVLGGLTLIWIAFTVEFAIKIAIAENRIEYLRRNWLDVIIIIIPILRPLRLASVARTTKVFTLRGVGFKFARYVFTLMIGMEATNRMMQRFGLRPRQERKPPEEMTRHELMTELARLRRLADGWQAWHAAQREHLAHHALPSLPADHPCDEAADDAAAPIEQRADVAAPPPPPPASASVLKQAHT